MGAGKKSKKKTKLNPSTPQNHRVEINKIISMFAKAFKGDLSEEEITQIGYYYSCIAPKEIFKYRSMINDYDIEALANGKMWFAELSTLNDPFEAYSDINIDSFIAAALQSDTSVRKDMQNRSYAEKMKLLNNVRQTVSTDAQGLFYTIRQDLSVSCFSERKDSMLMWGHYADGHRGVCVAYNTLELSRSNKKTVIPVNYSDIIPKLNGITEFEITRFFLEVLRTKATDWAYEKEWRCIQDKSACGQNWTNTGALLEVPRPKAIYLGCRTSNERTEQMKNLCNGQLRIPLYRMEQSKTMYQLVPVLIN